MKNLEQPEPRQLEQFLSALFLPNELIELRFIESWLSGATKRSRVVRPATWMRRRDIVAKHGQLTRLAERTFANIYFGVCPRRRPGDASDRSIATVRCLWCDVDSVTADEANDRWRKALVPEPSIIVGSGSGIHGYWLLEQDLTSPQERSRVAAMLPHFYRSFGGDHVQNLSRVLRPAGTVNYKDARNGRRPAPCTLLACQRRLRYPLEAFSRWSEQADAADRERAATTPRAPEQILSCRSDAAALVQDLRRPSRDRSRRDFAVVCDLLRLGLGREQIWRLVSGSSKFESNGRPYFDVTFANAERRILFDEVTASSPPRFRT
jgi:hypothetical protein